MTFSSPASKIEHDNSQINERYRCGSLQYTKASLIMLFGWMVWGNICFNLFEGQGGPSMIMMYLQDNFHVSNLTINIVFGVIPMILGTIMTPIISFKSDRTRGRWGRRIPYILFTAPFLAGFAALIGYSDDIISYCKTTFPQAGSINPMTVSLLVIGFLTIGFSFFNEFVGTVYYYLLPDVMPRVFIGRFQGVAHMAGVGSGILTNLYVVPYQLTHIKVIHVGVAILYFVGLGLVCLFVKEGQYPPVEDVTEKTRFSDQVKIYFRESFTHPIFILLYLSTATSAMTKGLNPAGIFSLHLSQHQAKVAAYTVADKPAETAAPAATNAADAGGRKTVPLLTAMTPDGKRAITNNKDTAITVWDIPGNEPALLKTVALQDGPATALALSADGKTAICGSADGAIDVVDLAGGKTGARLTGHAGSIQGLAFSSDARFAASASADRTVKIWNLASASCVSTLTGHEGQVNCVAFSSDASRLVSGGADRKILLWDVKTATLIETLRGHPGPVYSVCFAEALGDVPAHELPDRNWAMRQIFRAGVFLKQVFTNESLYDVPADESCKVLARDGWVLSGGRDGAEDDVNSRVRIWDVAQGRQVRELKGHKEAVTAVVYKRDLRVILSSSCDASIRLWKPWDIGKRADDQSYKTFSGYTRSVTSMALAQHGVKMLNASADGMLHLWDIDRGISLAKGGLRGIFFQLIALVFAYPLSSLVDRKNPIRIWLITMFLLLPPPLLNFFFLHDYTFTLILTFYTWPIGFLAGIAGMPVWIMLFPKTKYGQMSSANAMVKQAVTAVAGPIGAGIMDYLTTRSLETDYYRYGYLCQFVSHSISFVMILGVYYYWKKLGGDNYVAPEAAPAEAPAAAGQAVASATAR